MNPRAVLWLVLAGCAASRPHEPPPPPPTSCPVGHAELRPGPVGRQVATFESSEPGPPGHVCARCGYGCYANTRVWMREAASLEGFANPPAPLLRRVLERAPDASEVIYRQTSLGSESNEWLTFKSRRDLWAILLEEIPASDARGAVRQRPPENRWEGRLGERDLKIRVHLNEEGQSSFHAFLVHPSDPARIQSALRRSFTR
jgi:hypothetical protein